MIQITCDDCGKQIFESMSQEKKELTTISEIEHEICSDCLLKKVSKNKVNPPSSVEGEK